MIDHVGLPVSDLAASRAFDEAALGGIGHRLMSEITEDMTGGTGARFRCGVNHPDVRIGTGRPAVTGAHAAFSVTGRPQVHDVHAAALKAGGRDNGASGLRPQCHDSHHAAFALDPDGNNVGAVCHAPG